MKFKVEKDKVSNYTNFLRRAGYALIHDRRRGTKSFVRRLGRGHYPRLHLYVDDTGNSWSFNLHLDQKKASYEGHNMHNAEYDGEIVEGEIYRLKSLLGYQEKGKSNEFVLNESKEKESFSLSGNLEDDIKRNNYKKKKKFWFF
jgi:hypothetical protein